MGRWVTSKVTGQVRKELTYLLDRILGRSGQVERFEVSGHRHNMLSGNNGDKYWRSSGKKMGILFIFKKTGDVLTRKMKSKIVPICLILGQFFRSEKPVKR